MLAKTTFRRIVCLTVTLLMVSSLVSLSGNAQTERGIESLDGTIWEGVATVRGFYGGGETIVRLRFEDGFCYLSAVRDLSVLNPFVWDAQPIPYAMIDDESWAGDYDEEGVFSQCWFNFYQYPYRLRITVDGTFRNDLMKGTIFFDYWDSSCFGTWQAKGNYLVRRVNSHQSR